MPTLLLRMVVHVCVLASSDTPLDIRDIVTQAEDFGKTLDRAYPAEITALMKNDPLNKLYQLGPNILPDVMVVLEETKKAGVDESERTAILVQLASFLGGFEIYEYAVSPADRPKLYEPDDADLPVLKIDAEDRTHRSRNSLIALCAWWSMRTTFLSRTDVVDTVRRITGTTEAEFLQYEQDFRVWRRLVKNVLVYGIYNTPYFIQLIAEDNNPLVFEQWLGWSDEAERFMALFPRGIRCVQQAYPTRNAKLAIIRDWWKRNEDTYTRLADLHDAIDAAVKKYCPKDVPVPPIVPCEYAPADGSVAETTTDSRVGVEEHSVSNTAPLQSPATPPAVHTKATPLLYTVGIPGATAAFVVALLLFVLARRRHPSGSV